MTLFKGEPLLARTATRLSRQGFVVAVNSPASSGAAAWAAEQDMEVISDNPADPAGPLAGLKAGLKWAAGHGADLLVTTPCDTPSLPAGLEGALVSALTADACAAVARSPSGLQSLCAAWRVAPTLAALEAHFAAGRHPAVHDLLAELGAVEAPFPSDADFANLNTWDDIARAQES